MTIKCQNCKKEYPDELKGNYCPECGYLIGQELLHKSFTQSHPVLSHLGLVGLIALMLLPFFVLLGSLVESWKVFWAMPLAIAIIEVIVIGLELRSQTVRSKQPKNSWLKSRRKNLTIAVIVIMAISSSLLLVYLDSAYSWDPKFRIYDEDGDGVEDSVDKYPSDPEHWDDASSTVIVTIENGLEADIYFNLLLVVDSGRLLTARSGTIAEGGYAHETVVLSWRIGDYTTTKCLVQVRGYLHDGETYTPVTNSVVWLDLSPDETAWATLGTW